MSNSVCEMNPAGEIELADAQLGDIYGAWDEDCQPVCYQPVYQPVCYQPVYQPICYQRVYQPVYQEKPHCQKKETSLTFHKKVVFFYEEDISFEQNSSQRG